MKRVLLLIFVFGVLFWSHQAVHAQIHFTAKLNGAQENPPVTTTASGTGVFTLNQDLTELHYVITYRGLSGTLTAGGHFHTSPAGRNGPVVRNIASSGDPASATISGVWRSTDATQPLTQALVDSLLTGKVYVNFHTAANPGGEIRGQLNLSTPVHFTATLSGAGEVPPVTTTASGTGNFTLNPERTELQYDVTYRGLSGTLTAGGHFHTGAAGRNGPVVRNIASGGDPASATISGVWRSTDATQPLTPALVDSLLTGKVYVNFHTAANPGGEIRGQVMIATAISFMAKLDGGQENPPVTTTASGTGSFALNLDRTELKYEVTYIGLSGTLTAGGHFHTSPAGRNGPVVRNIASSGDPASATISGVWRSTDATQPLTPALIDSLLTGRIYVNFHTVANPGGEIRGQLRSPAGFAFTSRLDGAQENPPVSTTASGTGAFALNADRTEVQYDITYIGLSGTLTAGGHFHTSPAGRNGPVVRNIASGGDPASATISGVWRSTDATQPLTPALVDSFLTSKIYVNFHTAANPGGEIRGQLRSGKSLLTSVKENPGTIPLSFKLEQNYPNPFNPSTTIKFELAKSTRVSLKIYSLLGELVATLIDNELKAPGTYTTTFDASSLTSGVYFYKLETDAGFAGTRKLLFMK
ncbi:CHRD domain-containing protein [candidate division KSB1 bacterium]|nr:CHRD domain-containing protein [candidate division KSB1 bacterium]